MLASAPKDVPLREQSHLTLQNSHPDHLALEDRLCPGCKMSAVNEQGGLVVAFGQSFFHVDCFKCAKCRNQVTADTNLLLLSDGSPICANCSYSCNICKLPILDEAIMTGDDSYHAHCFKCKVCNNRIDELVFAKTSQGIYCMNCHNERMIKIRKHAQKKAERERAANGGSSSSRSRETEAKNFHRDQESRSVSQKPLNVNRRDHPDTSRSPTRNIHDGTPPNFSASLSVSQSPMNSYISVLSSPRVPVTVIAPTELENDHQTVDDRFLPTKSNTLPTPSTSTSLNSTRRGSDSLRSAPPAKGDLSDSGRAALGNGQLSSQTLSVTSRQDKRRSINPGLTISLFKDCSGAQSANHSPLTRSQETRHSPTSPFLTAVDNSSSLMPNTRSRSNSATSAHSKGDDDTVVMASPPSISPELDPTPRPLQRISQYSNFSGISGRSLSPIDAHNPIKRSSLASTSTSRAASPSHRADVPQGIDSDTEAETDSDRRPDPTSSHAPPVPPPKDTRSPDSVRTSPAITVESDGPESREEVDYAEDASSVEQTSHSTYIAPALPPIRFSMNNADFSELLSSVGGLPALKKTTVETSRKAPQADIPAPRAIISGSMTSQVEDPSPSSNLEKKGRLTPVMTVTPASEDITENAVVTNLNAETNKMQNARPAESESVLSKLREAIMSAKDRGAQQLQVDIDMVDAVIEHIESRDTTFAQLKSKVDGMNRESKRYIAGLTVAQVEYDQELKARRDAEAEVTRLRVLLSGQAVRLAALSGDSRKQELRQQLSKELHDNLAGLEHDLSRLKVERDMALAEVEELSAKTSNGNGLEIAPANVSRALTRRLEAIRTQYQRELLPLTEQKEVLCREIAELKSVRDMFLEETTVLNARNEELAQLSAVYARRIESGHEILSKPVPDSSRSSNDNFRGYHQAGLIVPSLSSSTSGSSTVYDDNSESRHMKILSSLPEFSTPAKGKFKWPGSKPKELVSPGSHQDHIVRKAAHKEHNFQQLSVLRFARCDHCGDKMWGSQLRCNVCATSIHVRCIANVQLHCTEKHRSVKEEPEILPPSMFGRDLGEQVRADSKDVVERQVPIIVEKCIQAVEFRALDYEGIYRKTGGSSQSKAITQLFERGDYDAFDLCDSDRFTDICSITSVLKTYFRSLPIPLLTFDLHDQFIQAVSLRDAVAKREMLIELINSMPNEHYYTLRMLMMHLHHVGKRADINLMTGRNLGVVFGPTLMRSRDPGAEFSDMAGKALFIEWLVENAPAVFRSSE